MGKNTISSNVTGSEVTEPIAECERIQVKAGDVIGIYFPYTTLGVEWSKCKVEDQPDSAVVRLRQHEDTLKPGQVGQFQAYGCMVLSLRAAVGPVANCSLPAVEANAEQVTSGDSVAVGQEAEYQCMSGYDLLSGHLQRRCGPCRELEGAAPTCGGACSM